MRPIIECYLLRAMEKELLIFPDLTLVFGVVFDGCSLVLCVGIVGFLSLFFAFSHGTDIID